MIAQTSAAVRRAFADAVGDVRDPDERQRRSFLVLVLLILVPVFVVFSLIDLRHGELSMAFPQLALAALFVVAVPWFRRQRSVVPVARLLLVTAVLVFLREVVRGGGEGFALLWGYLFPIFIFFVFGKIEGRRWVLLLLVSTAGAMLLSSWQYERALLMRFFVILALASLLSYALEAARAKAARELGAEKAALTDALGQIRALTGLLPICASCKKIRDGGGDWKQLESYITERTDAQFTHGICPDCARQYFPESSGTQQARGAASRARVPKP